VQSEFIERQFTIVYYLGEYSEMPPGARRDSSRDGREMRKAVPTAVDLIPIEQRRDNFRLIELSEPRIARCEGKLRLAKAATVKRQRACARVRIIGLFVSSSVTDRICERKLA